MVIKNDGNVGIGTNNPGQKLAVNGIISVEGNGTLTGNPAIMQLGGYYASPDAGRICFGDGTGWKLHISKAMPLTDLVTFRDNGNVGIGTTYPTARLEVYDGEIYHSWQHTNDNSANIVTYNLNGSCILGLWDYENATRGVFSSVSSDGSEPKIGVYASACGSAGTKYGVYARAGSKWGPDPDPDYAIYGVTPYLTGESYAGYFNGNVNVVHTLTKGAGGFKIDHPLDPENKYLYHSFVESPDMLNVYNGNIILDAKGEATVELPDYFEALNKDFRYQLTCIGGYAPIYIAQEVSGNSFKIAGGTAGMKVSWQVTGIRHDQFAESHRIQVEVEKTGAERGKYIHPKEYGVSETLGIDYEKTPRWRGDER